MDIECYLSYKTNKGTKGGPVGYGLMISGQKKNLPTLKVDRGGHYLTGLLDLISDWLESQEEEINTLTQFLHLHIYLHHKNTNTHRVFDKVNHTAKLCRNLHPTFQNMLIAENLTFKNYGKPVSYDAQVRLVRILIRLDKVFLIAQQDSKSLETEALFKLVSAKLKQYEAGEQTESNVIAFPN